MGDMADSRRNMRIDLRPKVVMRTMRVELLIFGAGIAACLMMPLYFLKLRPYGENWFQEIKDRKEIIAEEKLAAETIE